MSNINYILLIQTFIQAMKDVEALMPESKGKEKFEAAIEMVENIFGKVTGMIPALLGVATTVVNALRAIGVFKKKAATIDPV
jgi:hypothetical protein